MCKTERTHFLTKFPKSTNKKKYRKKGFLSQSLPCAISLSSRARKTVSGGRTRQ